MRHRFKVIEYCESQMCHRCQASDAKNNETELIDLQVNKHLGMDDKDLVGRIVTMDYHYPYISIGMGVRVEG